MAGVRRKRMRKSKSNGKDVLKIQHVDRKSERIWRTVTTMKQRDLFDIL